MIAPTFRATTWRRARPAILLVTPAIVALGCHHDMTPVPEVLDLPPSEGPFESVVAADTNPDPHVVEVSIEARVANVELAPGHVVPMWTYDGLVPGPRIEARRGDRVRVHFTNHLPEATTIHWHGVRVPAEMDGMPEDPIAVGATFTFEFDVPDSGTFWYHPHLRANVQVERGLYGAFVVRGDDEPATTTDRVVVLDDVLVNPDWTIAGSSMMETMVGRQGNVILANGRAHPIAPMTRGGIHRFRFVNAANARYFRLALPGRTFTLIGGDGGLFEAPRVVSEALLVPGQRLDVVVEGPSDAGERLDWVTLDYDRGHGTGGMPTASLFQQRSGTEDPVASAALPARLATIEPLPSATRTRELRLEESMGEMGSMHTMGGMGHMGGSMGMTFAINGESYPNVTPLEGKLGTVEEWSVVNTAAMDHPFHLHGFRFQVVSEDGAAPLDRAWRDTVNVPAHTTTRLRLRLEDHAGRWMYHCHILEHAEAGMMGMIDVAE